MCLGLAPPRLHFGRGVDNDDGTACSVYEERLGVGLCIAPLFPVDMQRFPGCDSKSLHVPSEGVASFETVLLFPLGKKCF